MCGAVIAAIAGAASAQMYTSSPAGPILIPFLNGSAGKILAWNSGLGTSTGVVLNSAGALTSPAAATVGTVATIAGTTSTSAAVMLGLNQTITPLATGRLRIIISGDAYSGVIGDGCLLQLSYGTGTVPTAGGTLTGTQVGANLKLVAATVAQRNGWSHSWIVTGLTVGTAYWVDEAFEATTGSTCTVENINITAEEF